jgi:hypothetical protein
MELFNPHDAWKRGRGRPPTEPPDNPIPAACIWEALRHNEMFCADVEIIRTAGSDWDHGHQNVNQRVGKAHLLAKKCLRWIVPEIVSEDCRTIHDTSLDLSQPWPKTPVWFRDAIVQECAGDLSLPKTTRTDDAVIETDLSERLMEMLNEKDGVGTTQLVLRRLRGRLVALPDVVCESSKEVDAILEQIRPLIRKVHGNKDLYPSRLNWDAFLEFFRYDSEGHFQSFSHAMVFRKCAPKRWRMLVERNGGDPDTIDPYVAAELIQDDVKDLHEVKKPSCFQHIDNVKQYIDGIYYAR